MRHLIKVVLLAMVILVTLDSCSRDDLVNSFPSEIKFDVTAHLLKGKKINCLAIDERGDAFVCSDSKLYIIGKKSQEEYDLGCEIMDIAIAPDKTVWLGSNGKGLGCFSNGNLKWYNSENAGFPRDYVWSVAIGQNGKIWFSSSAHKVGGLGIYDGKRFEFMTPENSPLNQNLIEDIEADNEGRIYVATIGTVGRTNIYRISGNSWDCLGNEEGTFYWVYSFSVGPTGNIYLVEDFSLSSAMMTNRFYMFNGTGWQDIEPEESSALGYFSRIKADLRDYCWITAWLVPDKSISVFDGANWHYPPDDFLGDRRVTALEVDSENNIWIGTLNDGVLILNQK